MTRKDAAELLPCPFCGDRHGVSTQVITGQWKNTNSFETFVMCGLCQIRGPSCVSRDMPEVREINAIKLWNTRQPHSAVKGTGNKNTEPLICRTEDGDGHKVVILAEWYYEEIMKALNEQPQRVDEWGPIEGAPRDQHILLFDPKNLQTFIGRWAEEKGVWLSGSKNLFENIEGKEPTVVMVQFPLYPSHWMPIPNPPAAQTEGE